MKEYIPGYGESSGDVGQSSINAAQVAMNMLADNSDGRSSASLGVARLKGGYPLNRWWFLGRLRPSLYTLAKTLRLTRHLRLTSRKRGACHQICTGPCESADSCTSPSKSAAPASQTNVAKSARVHAERAPTRRDQANFRRSQSRGCTLSHNSTHPPHAHARLFFSCHLSQGAGFQLVAVPCKFLPNFL